MGGKGSSGSADYGPMLEYGEKALDIQKDIYEEGKGFTEPWYQTGKSALGELGLLMGLGGGGEFTQGGMNRGDVYNMLRGGYTTTTGAPGYDWKTYGEYGDYEGALAARRSGKISNLDLMAMQAMEQGRGKTTDALRYIIDADTWRGSGGGDESRFHSDAELLSALQGLGAAGTSTTSIDQTGLNAAVDAYMAEHGMDTTTPKFGQLREGFDLDKFQTDPGYEFRLGEGEKAIQRQLASQGKTFSPEQVKALTGYSQNLATDEYGKAYGRYEGEKADLYNRLANMAGMGQTATGQRANIGGQYAQGATDIYGGIGSAATEAGIAAASQPSMFDKLLGAGATIAGGWLSDRRLKENIKTVGIEKGFPVYTYNYKGGRKRFKGVMAQDVEGIMPEAVVTTINGYKAVNYDVIGLKMEAV